ncbi:A24 family peptidase [Ectobacillus ponti]|uniref:A24 family peptidase n=1 Tax=Ectobacillus ponti TaxID=2961894 RepID=A0AA41X5J0_9BACI|nr:A24 family peptidase [Ectobacillus ponti]MCP8969321.1 A24 family peptidase [Ectobacillus ponti]
MIIQSVLGITLITSLITDIRQRKILNIVTFPAMLFGFLYHTAAQGWNGVLFSVSGFLVGLGVLLIPHLLGGMGAGDVKLMAAVGAMMGSAFVFHAFLYTAIIGGVISAALIMKKNGMWNTIKSAIFIVIFLRMDVVVSPDGKGHITFPYGIAIVLGTGCTFVWGGLA